MAKVEVLHCAETIKGGIATYLRELLPLQANAIGAENIVVVIPESQAGELPLPVGVRLLTFPDNGGRVANAFAQAGVVRRFVRDNPVRIAHIHSTFSGATVRPLLKLFRPRTKIVYCPHGWAWDRPMKPWKKTAVKLVERALAVFSNKIVCISNHERQTALAAGLPAGQLAVVLNGIANFVPTSSGTRPEWPQGLRKLLFVGRFDHQKGVDIFCDALAKLGEDACGLLVGDQVLGDDQVLHIPKNVRKVGWLKSQKLQDLYLSADALIIPSRWEGFGLVAAEAMRANLAVIAPKVGGLHEVVDDGRTGLLVDPCTVDGVVGAVRSLDDQALQKMGDAGRVRFEQLFTIDRVHRELLDIYKAL